MRMLLSLLALSACAPNRPFKPGPPKPGVGCVDWPAIAANQSLPNADRDVDGDGKPDYVTSSNCDAAGNCDLTVYLGSKSCALRITTLRGVAVFPTGAGREFEALERVTIDGVEAHRRVAWRLDLTSGVWGQASDQLCERTPGDTEDRGTCKPLLGEPAALDPAAPPPLPVEPPLAPPSATPPGVPQ